MTKWFDTNYHYLVPEIGPDTPLRFAGPTRSPDRFDGGPRVGLCDASPVLGRPA